MKSRLFIAACSVCVRLMSGALMWLKAVTACCCWCSKAQVYCSSSAEIRKIFFIMSYDFLGVTD